MAISHRYHTDHDRLTLELTMRDALGGLEELASLDAYWFDPACMEILGIEPPGWDARFNATPLSRSKATAQILQFSEGRPHHRSGTG